MNSTPKQVKSVKGSMVNRENIKPCPDCGSSELFILVNNQTNKYNFAHFCHSVEWDTLFKMITAEETFETEQEAIEAWNKRV